MKFKVFEDWVWDSFSRSEFNENDRLHCLHVIDLIHKTVFFLREHTWRKHYEDYIFKFIVKPTQNIINANDRAQRERHVGILNVLIDRYPTINWMKAYNDNGPVGVSELITNEMFEELDGCDTKNCKPF